MNKKILTIIISISLIGASVLSLTPSELKKRDEQARAKYNIAKQQYQREINFYKTARAQFQNAKTKYRKFRTKENKQEYEQAVKNFFRKTVDVLIKRLESIKTWIENRTALSESEKAKIIAEIDKDITWLQSHKTGIDTASAAQFKERINDIRNYWKKNRVFVSGILAKVWIARVESSIKKAETLKERINGKILLLKEKGVDTTKLESLLNNFERKITIAKEKVNNSKEKANEKNVYSITDLNFQQRKTVIKQAHNFLKEANRYLNDAYKDLKNIIKEMRTIKVTAAVQEGADITTSKENETSE